MDESYCLLDEDFVACSDHETETLAHARRLFGLLHPYEVIVRRSSGRRGAGGFVINATGKSTANEASQEKSGSANGSVAT